MIVGEIGLPRREFLYEICFWEVLIIIRGYNRRYRNMWSAMRWQTFHIMEAQVGTDAMHKANLFKPGDLMQFSWDREPSPPITDDERAELIAEMAAINALNKSTET